MEHEVRRRLTGISLYQETNDAGLVCRRCGIWRPTLRKWVQRYEEQGVEGLVSQSRRPKHSPAQKVFEQEEGWILALTAP
jgi:transposase